MVNRVWVILFVGTLNLILVFGQDQHQPPPPQQYQQQPAPQQHQQPPQHQEIPQHQQVPQQQVPQQHQEIPQHQQVHQQQVPQHQQVPQQHQQPPPQQQYQEQNAGHHQFGKDEEVHDSQHIKAHLDGQVNVDERQMTNEQLQFHYFTMHDLNKDNMLDGIELIKAITHWHGAEEDPQMQQHMPPKLAENELENMIDSILQDDDFNNDGYIDYGEFVRAQTSRAAQAPPPPTSPH